MYDEELRELASRFRDAMDCAKAEDAFADDARFCQFPVACCGEASDLLAEYLRKHGVETIWVSNERGDWTHAWLVVNDARIPEPEVMCSYYPDDIKVVLASYGQMQNEEMASTHYDAEDISKGLIIDITADQFPDCDTPVYVGYMDAFHESFDYIQAFEYNGLDSRLQALYEKVSVYLMRFNRS